MNILTAEEFVRQFRKTNPIAQAESIEHWMGQHCIEFAKMHVEAALKSASEKAYVEYIDLETNEIFDYTDVITDDNVGADVNVKSILKAYPLNNIK